MKYVAYPKMTDNNNRKEISCMLISQNEPTSHDVCFCVNKLYFVSCKAYIICIQTFLTYNRYCPKKMKVSGNLSSVTQWIITLQYTRYSFTSDQGIIFNLLKAVSIQKKGDGEMFISLVQHILEDMYSTYSVETMPYFHKTQSAYNALNTQQLAH